MCVWRVMFDLRDYLVCLNLLLFLSLLLLDGVVIDLLFGLIAFLLVFGC